MVFIFSISAGCTSPRFTVPGGSDEYSSASTSSSPHFSEGCEVMKKRIEGNRGASFYSISSGNTFMPPVFITLSKRPRQ